MKCTIVERRDPQIGRRRRPASVGLRMKSAVQSFPSASIGLFSIFDQAIVSGTGFLTAMIIGRTVLPDQLGLYYLVLTIVLIVSGIHDQVIASPFIVYSKRRSGRELAEYAGSVWLYHLVLTMLVVGVVVVAIAVCAAAGSTRILPGLVALLGALPLLLLRDGVRRFSYANLRVRSAIRLDAIVAAAQLGGLVSLKYLGILSLFTIYATMGAACGMACLGWYLMDPPRVRFKRERFLPDWRGNWSFGKWALRSYLVGNTTPYVMLWILSLIVGTASTGVLGACNTIIGLMNVVLSGVSNVLTPQAAQAFASGGPTDLRRILCSTAGFFALSLGSFALFVLLTGDLLPVFVFGPLYRGSGPILFTLSLSTLMSSLGMVAGNGLWAIDQPRANFVADVCCMSVTLIAAAILIIHFGALGAALATLAGTATAALVRTMTLLRRIDSPVGQTNANVNPAVSS